MGTHSGALGEVAMERGTKKYGTVKNTGREARIRATHNDALARGWDGGTRQKARDNEKKNE